MIRRHFFKWIGTLAATPWLSWPIRRTEAAQDAAPNRATVVVYNDEQLRAALKMECPRNIVLRKPDESSPTRL